jgi:hypothetical protein
LDIRDSGIEPIWNLVLGAYLEPGIRDLVLRVGRGLGVPEWEPTSSLEFGAWSVFGVWGLKSGASPGLGVGESGLGICRYVIASTNASTIPGSNCVPAHRLSSAIASSRANLVE